LNFTKDEVVDLRWFVRLRAHLLPNLCSSVPDNQ
jgi:hypothetical protein